MAEIQQTSSTVPPKKYRDPVLAERSKDELKQRQEEYIGGMVKSAARKSLLQGTMAPTSLHIGTDGKKKLCELEERLLLEPKLILNMALAYAYTEAKQRRISSDELRTRIQSMQLDEEYVAFEINEQVLNILFDSGIGDAQFIYVNAGLDLLYCRLVKTDLSSVVWN